MLLGPLKPRKTYLKHTENTFYEENRRRIQNQNSYVKLWSGASKLLKPPVIFIKLFQHPIIPSALKPFIFILVLPWIHVCIHRQAHKHQHS